MKSSATLLAATLLLSLPAWALDQAEAESACKSWKLRCPEGSQPSGGKGEKQLGCKAARASKSLRAQRVGPYVECSAEGRVELFGEWSTAGRRDGTWVTLYRDGRSMKTEYREGRLEGKVVQTFSDGKVQLESEYRGGRQHGTSRGYRADGALSFEEEWSQGRQVRSVRYDTNGKPQTPQEAARGVGAGVKVPRAKKKQAPAAAQATAGTE